MTLAKEPMLTLRQLMVDDILMKQNVVVGIRTENGETIHCTAVVIATGTYLRGRIIVGDVSYWAGPNGQRSASNLSD